MMAREPMPDRWRLTLVTPRLRRIAACLLPALLLAACTAGPGAPAPSASPSAPAPSASPAPVATASPAPVPSVSPAPVATASPAPASPTEAPSGSAGVVGGNPGITPIPVGPGSSIGPVPVQPPTDVTPVANLLNVHDVRAESVSTTATDGRVTVTLVWWSGPTPCSVLSEVHVARSGSAFTLTVREGSQQLGIACPAIAVHKQATVDLGDLPAGNYSMAATGVDTPVTVTVSG